MFKHFKITFFQKCWSLTRNKLGNKAHLINNEYKKNSLFIRTACKEFAK